MLHLYNYVVVTKVFILLRDQKVNKVNSSDVKSYGPMHRLENLYVTHIRDAYRGIYIKYLCSIYMNERVTCISCSVPKKHASRTKLTQVMDR